MKPNEAVKSIMTDKEIRMCTLCDRLDMKSNTLANKLARENIGVDNLVELLRALDYKLVAIPRDVRTPTGGKEIG